MRIFKIAVIGLTVTWIGGLGADLGSAAPLPPIQGVVVPLVTPFDATGTHVDLRAMRSHVAWLLTKPVDWFFPIGGLGQWRALTQSEKKDIIRTVVEVVHGEKPVAPGITGLTLTETIELGKFAAANGAAAVSVAIPEYLRPKDGAPTQASLFEFYKSVHDALNIPVLIYDSQGDLAPETMTRLAKLPRIKAIKYRTKDIERFLRMCQAAGDTVAVLAGIEHEGVAALAAGAKGIVGGGANVFPQLIDQVIKRFDAGDIDGARAATFAVIEANDGVPGAQEIKYALSKYYGIKMSQSPRGRRDAPLTIAERDRLDAAMRRADPALEPPSDDLNQKRERYLKLTADIHDASGFVHNKCDGVTFTALSCIARGLPKDQCPAYKARDEKVPGLWYRHAEHDCFERDGKDGGAPSDNSPDVFTSLALLFWHYQDLASVAAIIDYGEHHAWTMGRARKDMAAKTVKWSPDLKALYYELRYRLGGPDHPGRKALIRSPRLGEGWEAHIAANRLLLIGLMTGELTADEVTALDELATREPHNGLFQALDARLAYGDEASASKALLDERHFPAAALPNSRENHCEEYLFQRSEKDGAAPNANWLPCPTEPLKTHSGTDFLWAACVLTPGCL